MSKVIDHSDKVLRRMNQNINDLLVVSSEIVRSEIVRTVSVDKGALRDSYVANVDDKTAVIGSNLEYAARIELGFVGNDILGRTFNQSGDHAAENALKNNKKGILDLFKRKILK